MDHKYIDEVELVERYLMGRLAPEETAEFETHFVDCVQCVDQLNTTNALLDGLRTVASDRALAKTGHAPKARAWSLLPWSFGKPSLAAAVLLLIVSAAASVVFIQIRRSSNDAAQARIASAEWQRRYEEERESASLAEMRHQDSNRDLSAQNAQLRAALEDEHKQNAQEMVAHGALKKPQINIATFVLRAVRASEPTIGALNEIAVPRSPANFVLSVQLEEEGYKTYSMTILGDRNRPVWKGRGLKLDRYNSVSVEFNSTFFRDGHYTLIVYGVAGDGSTKVVSEYSFRVAKTP